MLASFETRVGQGSAGALHPAFDADVWPSVLRTFQAAIHDPSSAAMTELHAAAREFAVTVRAQELPPERAVMALKALLAGHGAGGWSPSLDDNHEGVHLEARVYAQLFAWFVEAFYNDEGDD